MQMYDKYEFNAELITDNIIAWIREQAGTCNIAIGISGGKDSTITAMLSVLAIGKDKVFGVMMPNGMQKDINDSKKVCKLLGINANIINIGNVCNDLASAIWHSSFEDFCKGSLLSKRMQEIMRVNNTFGDMYDTNTPARVRMTTLYGIAAILGNTRVVNTCNLSEDWVGYSTKFGDSAGDFSPLANLTVAEVLQVGVVCATRLGIYDELKDLIFKTPDDGMSGKSDEEKLGFTYDELDRYIRTGEILNLVHKEKIDRMHAANLHKVTLMPKFESGLEIRI